MLLTNPLTRQILNANPEGCNQYKHGCATGIHSAHRRLKAVMKARKMGGEAVTASAHNPLGGMPALIMQQIEGKANAGYPHRGKAAHSSYASSPVKMSQVHLDFALETEKDIQDVLENLKRSAQTKEQIAEARRILYKLADIKRTQERASAAYDKLHRID